MALFWDRDNWQPLCAPCHDSHKKRMESKPVTSTCDIDGTPTDQRHPWNRP